MKSDPSPYTRQSNQPAVDTLPNDHSRMRREGDSTYDEIVGEPDIERQRVLYALDVLVRERDVERLEVALQVLDLAPAHNREDMRRLLHKVCDRNCV